MKYKKILITFLIMIAIVMIGNTKVEAASAEISTPNQTVEVGDNVTITVEFTAAAWNLKVSGNGISGESYASQTSDLTEAKTEKTFKLDTSKAGTYTISLKGDITDKDGNTIEINKTCKVTVNEKKVEVKEPEPEKPATTTPTTPTTPEKPKEVEFKETNETVYATGTVNVRKSYSSDATKLGSLSKGDSVTRIGKSTSKADGYYWSKITYNGQTAYVITSKLSTEKPVEEPEKPVEEPKEETPEEPTATADESEENTETTGELKGLKSLEIEGITLSLEFETDTYNYEAVLKKDIKELKINVEKLDEAQTITIAGNKNIQEGENLITIIVYNAKGEAEATYQITVNKNTVDISATDEVLKYGNQAATLKTTIYMVAIILTTILLITVLIVRYKTQNQKEEIQIEQEKTPIKEKEDKFAIKEEKKGKHF